MMSPTLNDIKEKEFEALLEQVDAFAKIWNYDTYDIAQEICDAFKPMELEGKAK